jgi:hypothetical protein
LRHIREEEQNREYRPFSDWRLLKPAYYFKVCIAESWVSRSIEATGGGNGPRFVLRGGEPVYESFQPCLWMGVKAYAYDGQGKPLRLHVWGGGVNDRIVADEEQVTILSYESRESRHYYFAQLGNSDYQPVSCIYPVETSGSCEKNMITLVFDEVTSATSP